jgi:UDP:flavonoid glycosyltransferase YjiC (YdhE family)
MNGRRNLRVLVAAFGDAGHAFPAIALGRALAARGHAVTVETWEHWRGAVEEVGLGFHAAEEYTVFPPPPPDGSRGPTAAQAARALEPLFRDLEPDVVVSDILTAAPALAAEVAGVRRVTLIPHAFPVQEPGLPIWALGMLPPRTALGARAWRAAAPLLGFGLRRGRDEMNETRAQLGLAPLDRYHGGISEGLALVATFPQLEYPRRWPAHVQVTGPLFFELPHPEVELPPGDEPLVLAAPSTAKDSEQRLVRATLEALSEEPVRVVATTNRRDHMEWRARAEEIPVPDNAVLVDWLSYSQVMPEASLVICHGGHGTVARALSAGAPVLVSPALGDMAENGARVAWAGAGLMVPGRLTRPAALGAVVRRILGDPSFAERAGEIAAWARDNDGAERGAGLVESYAKS